MSAANYRLMLSVARQLRPLLPEVMFVGGTVTALHLTDRAAPEVRATVDVDITARITTYGRFQAFADRLRELGFREDAAGHTGRFLHEGLVLDVIPSEPVLGSTNRWYAPALPHALHVTLEDGLVARVINAPYFLATKFEAFEDRGRTDPYGSKDLTDIVSVLDGRPEVTGEVQHAHAELRTYLAERCAHLLLEPELPDWLSAVLPSDAASQARAATVERRLAALAALVP